MSNYITIQPTKFTNVRTGEETFGYRIYDENGQIYDNTWKDIPEDDLDVLERVLQEPSDVAGDMLDFVRENKTGIYIGEEFYSWKQIKDIMLATA
jgi:hypothetical protein